MPYCSSTAAALPQLGVLAAASDALDGFLARRWHAVSTADGQLDVCADLAILVGGYGALGLSGLIPGWPMLLPVGSSSPSCAPPPGPDRSTTRWGVLRSAGTADPGPHWRITGRCPDRSPAHSSCLRLRPHGGVRWAPMRYGTRSRSAPTTATGRDPSHRTRTPV
ncbi:CDP-alcohol phosphatidyltransferase family protein [Rhodococcus opacus]|uniref:CDP-diacylglycerol--glycerol-3-phosphate 3-phosphatidyltransferase n=2 Tax=Nocardiaceae TaxID=85025 RepID=K8XBQ5_RHOOP|nr:CDP-diacylglycerol--glycerol-3-phosphate 3-phosphatidyltransferase [Rhodococcus opacus M213]